MEKSENFDMETVDLRLYLKILLKWKWLITGITLLAIVTSALLSFFVLSPVYQSKTVLMVKQYQDLKAVQSQDKQEDLESVVNSLSRLPQMTIKTYVGQIKNEALIRNVIDTLKLDKLIYTPDSMTKLIDVKVLPDTNLIEIAVKNNDSELAARIANALAEKFLEFVGSANEKQLVMSADFLSKQLAEKNKELTEAVSNLNKYRNQERNVAYIEQEIQNKNQNLANYQNQLLQAETEYHKSLAGKVAAEEKMEGVPERFKVNKVDEKSGSAMETEVINPVYSELAGLEAQKGVELAEMEASKNSIQTIVDRLQTEMKNLQAELNGKKEVDSQL